MYNFVTDELKKQYSMFVPTFSFKNPASQEMYNKAFAKLDIHSSPEDIINAKPETDKAGNLSRT